MRSTAAIPFDYASMVKVIRAETRITPKVAIAELFDNAIDAASKNIWVRFDEPAREITVEDDGVGCSDMELLAGFGSSQPATETARIGRYGVGAKKSAIVMCDEQRVISIRNNSRLEFFVPWGEIANGAPFEYHFLPATRTESSSKTVITLAKVRKDYAFRSSTRREAIEYWSRVYCPALLSGRNIIVDGVALEPFPFPAIKEAHDEIGEFEGRRYRLRVGILSQDDMAQWRPGWWVACAGRLLNDKAFLDGTDEYPGAAFWGYVELVDGADEATRWSLDVHKTDFAERERFFEYLSKRLSGLLRRATEQTHDVRVSQLERALSEVAAMAFGGMARIREMRAQGETEGTSQPANTGRKRTRADKSDPQHEGSVVNPLHRQVKAWRFMFVPLGTPGPICEADLTKTSVCVRFNKDNRFVTEHMEFGKKSEATLIALACHFVWAEANKNQRINLWANQYPAAADFELSSDDSVAEAKWMNALLNAYAEFDENRGQVRSAA